MITLKAWSEFLFDFWKFLKKYHGTDNFEAAVKEADAIMTKHGSKWIFDGMMFGLLEQLSMESIRNK